MTGGKRKITLKRTGAVSLELVCSKAISRGLHRNYRHVKLLLSPLPAIISMFDLGPFERYVSRLQTGV